MTSPEELVLAIPYVLGLVPTESLVVVPLGLGGPVSRIDIPATAADRDAVAGSVIATLAQHLDRDSAVAVVCFSDSHETSVIATDHLAASLESVGISVSPRLWVTGRGWTDLATGEGGQRPPKALLQGGTESIARFRGTPLSSRDDAGLAAGGDVAPMVVIVERTRMELAEAVPRTERSWVLDRLDRFEWTGEPLGDADVARLLVDVQDVGLRDAVLARMSSSNAVLQRSLWTDVAVRAPAEVRPAAATAAGFAAWLAGDGAAAWAALDDVPEQDRSRGPAGLLTQALREGWHPSTWDGTRRDIDADELGPRESFRMQGPSWQLTRHPLRGPGRHRPSVP